MVLNMKEKKFLIALISLVTATAISFVGTLGWFISKRLVNNSISNISIFNLSGDFYYFNDNKVTTVGGETKFSGFNITDYPYPSIDALDDFTLYDPKAVPALNPLNMVEALPDTRYMYMFNLNATHAMDNCNFYIDYTIPDATINPYNGNKKIYVDGGSNDKTINLSYAVNVYVLNPISTFDTTAFTQINTFANAESTTLTDCFLASSTVDDARNIKNIDVPLGSSYFCFMIEFSNLSNCYFKYDEDTTHVSSDPNVDYFIQDSVNGNSNVYQGMSIRFTQVGFNSDNN
jgi:hypothetical protein